MGRIKNVLVYIISFVLIVSTISSIRAAYVFADTNVKGIVTALRGSVHIKHQGSEKKTVIYKKMNVTQGDTLITGSNSSLTITINSKEIILGENTQIVIDELWGNKMAEGTSISLIRGSILNVINDKLNINSKNEIKTPTTIIGARGTKFVSVYQESTGTQIAVLEGSVYAVPASNGLQPPTGAEQITETIVLTPGLDAGDYGLDLNQIDMGLLETILISDAFSYKDKYVLEQVAQVIYEMAEERLKAEKAEQELKIAEQERLAVLEDEDSQDSSNHYIPTKDVNKDYDNTYTYDGNEIKITGDISEHHQYIKEKAIEACTEVPEQIKQVLLTEENVSFVNPRHTDTVEGEVAIQVDMEIEYTIDGKKQKLCIKDIRIICKIDKEPDVPEEEPENEAPDINEFDAE